MARIDPDLEIAIDWRGDIDSLADEIRNMGSVGPVARTSAGHAYWVTIPAVSPNYRAVLIEPTVDFFHRRGLYSKGTFRYKILFSQVEDPDLLSRADAVLFTKNLTAALNVDSVAALVPDADDDRADPRDIEIVFDSRSQT